MSDPTAGPSRSDRPGGSGPGGHADLRSRVETILELIRPAILSDGGDVELVGVRDDGTVLVRFHGACVGCPSSGITLQVGIERQLKTLLPEVNGVESVG